MSTPQSLGSFQTLSVPWAAAAAAAALVILYFWGFSAQDNRMYVSKDKANNNPRIPIILLLPTPFSCVCVSSKTGCSYNTRHMVQHQGHLPLWALLPSLHSGEGQTGLVSLTQLVKSLATKSDRLSLVPGTKDLVHASCPLTSPCTHVNRQNMKFIIILKISHKRLAEKFSFVI